MSAKHLSLSPRNLRVKRGRVEAWRYEERYGLTVMVTASTETAEIRIPAKMMRDYLRRRAQGET